MKKVLTLLVIAVALVSCTQNQMAKNFGGTETITLEPGKRLVNVTWKGDKGSANLWILTKQDTTKPTTYSFKEKSDAGILEGEVIIKEQ